ncbi:helix-turn-helix domain-containing protein [Streptomyces griseus]|uniref:helix-turn-helix domain-containing protein n=1 Tax=Streptomyces griseus TaxID=1911 RepID=UPI00083FFC1A|nr:helix-turn-helix domain-containing protein [Streptomyces griseus]
MSRWQELPDSLDQKVRQFVVQLRRLKDRSGLSLVSLASKTGYSRSSWERYLNGKALPPRAAVEELARVAGTDPVRLLVLHEVAEEAWQQPIVPSSSAGAKDGGTLGVRGETAAERSGAAEGSAASAEGPRIPEELPAIAQPPGVRRPVALAAVVAATLVGVGTGMLTAAPWGDDDGGGDKTKTAVGGPLPSSSSGGATEGPGRYVFEPGKSYFCKVHRAGAAGGGLFAGYSTTRTAVLAGPGWDVVEAQCLLSYHKMEPGPVDGVYGQQTIAAVMRLQKKAGLPADGVVGPHTWQVLR